MNKIRVRRLALLMIMVLVAMCVVGCSKNDAKAADAKVRKRATMIIDEQSQVMITYTEDFDKSNYNHDELEPTINEELLEFNNKISNENGAKLESFDVNSDKKASLKIEFIDSDTYTKYVGEYVQPDRNIKLSIGSYNEVVAKGYLFGGSFINADDLSQITKDKFSDLENLMVVYTNEAQKILIPGTIVYFSDTVSLEEGLAITSDNLENYIIFTLDKK